MPVERSVEAFKVGGMNCAQSVLHGYKELHGVSDEQIAGAKAFGGGRAEAGTCGALYAAQMIAKSDEARESLTKEFREVAGAERCVDIKRGSGYACDKCVELAAELIGKYS